MKIWWKGGSFHQNLVKDELDGDWPRRFYVDVDGLGIRFIIENLQSF